MKKLHKIMPVQAKGRKHELCIPCLRVGFLPHNLLNKCHHCFLPEEITHLESMPTASAKQRFMAGRILAKTMIAEITGENPDSVIFTVLGNGCPVHEYDIPVFFSISHSETLSSVAISSTPLGMDLEWQDPKRNIDAIAEAFFHLSEIHRLNQSFSRDEKILLFYRYWTTKEAYIKAHGLTIWHAGCIPQAVIPCNERSTSIWMELPGNYTISIYVPAGLRKWDIEFHRDFYLPDSSENIIIGKGHFCLGEE